jgi:hypothetical protein
MTKFAALVGKNKDIIISVFDAGSWAEAEAVKESLRATLDHGKVRKTTIHIREATEKEVREFVTTGYVATKKGVVQ